MNMLTDFFGPLGVEINPGDARFLGIFGIERPYFGTGIYYTGVPCPP